MVTLYIFDLDGTLTPERESSCDPFQRVLLPNVEAKLRALKKRKNYISIASNQSCGRKDITSFIEWVRIRIVIDAVQYTTVKARMKPSPWMLNALMAKFRVERESVVMVGDSVTDQRAAEAAGVAFTHRDIFFEKE